LVPQQLPAEAGFFVGRESELKALDELLDQHGDSGGPGWYRWWRSGVWPALARNVSPAMAESQLSCARGA
jgi:hypothetical protein